MKPKSKLLVLGACLIAVVVVAAIYLQGSNIAVLNPKGTIAEKQRNLLIFAALLSLIVVIPVYVMTFYIAWRYREGHPKQAKYRPDWDHNNIIEAIWWGVPLTLILILSIVTWRSSQELDPFKPVQAAAKPLTIQVVALDWKWLFIYPEQNIATVNFVQFPINTPLKFEITADAPMNSFWIPNLGGQIYAMTGMSTHLNLLANKAGDYAGSSANISGRGFAGMRFTARASSQTEFNNWLEFVRRNPATLTADEYSRLAQPSENLPPTYYGSVEHKLYDKIVMKYMLPNSQLAE